MKANNDEPNMEDAELMRRRHVLDCVINRILQLLPTTPAAWMSFLSKQWEGLRSSVFVLDLNKGNVYHNFDDQRPRNFIKDWEGYQFRENDKQLLYKFMRYFDGDATILRICSKKRHTTSDGTEQNMGWSWLERWMATRPAEISPAESHISNHVEPIHSSQRFVIGKRFFDVAGEEKESCGSNEVGVLFDNFPVPAEEKDGLSPTKNRFKATRSL
ncbi:hypothetical protein COP2_024793 [Malus domestica]